MYETFQIVANEKVKKEALNESMTQRQSIKGLVHSKRYASVNNSVAKHRKDSSISRIGPEF